MTRGDTCPVVVVVGAYSRKDYGIICNVLVGLWTCTNVDKSYNSHLNGLTVASGDSVVFFCPGGGGGDWRGRLCPFI